MQQRQIGLILGVMAWCMQLVVFVQPFLPGQFVPGFGVCQMIVTALTRDDNGSLSASHSSQHSAVSASAVAAADSHSLHQAVYADQHANSYPTHPHHDYHNNYQNNHHNNHDHAAAWLAVASTDLSASQSSGGAVLGSHGADQHASHLSCGFCTLYGHAIPPPPALQWEFDIRPIVYAIQPLFVYYSFIQFNSYYLKPQSHAPPINF